METDVLNPDNTQADLEVESAANLRRCRELLDRLGRSRTMVEPDSWAARHYAERGHYPSFACCALGSDAERHRRAV